MCSVEHFDIFISYRRDGGYDTAQLLYDRLTQMRYRVSFDLETLRGGKFNAQLYQRIEQCSDVLVIMSKDSLSLRDNPDDNWFRLEIAHALKHKKNIVPVFLRDFKFPHKGELPPDIADIVDYQGVTASPEHFDSTLKKLCRNFKSKPVRRVGKSVGIAIALLLTAATVGAVIYSDRLFPYPFTRLQKQQFSKIEANISMQAIVYNDAAKAWRRLLDSMRRSVLSGDRSIFEDATVRFGNELSTISAHGDATPSADLLSIVAEGPIDAGGYEGLHKTLNVETNSFVQTSKLLSVLYGGTSAMDADRADMLHLIDIYQRLLELSCEHFAVYLTGILSVVDEKSLSKFKQKMVPMLEMLPELKRPWQRDEAEVERHLDTIAERIKEQLDELSSLIGNKHLERRSIERRIDEARQLAQEALHEIQQAEDTK